MQDAPRDHAANGRIVSADDVDGRMRLIRRQQLPSEYRHLADQADWCNWTSWTSSERYVWGAMRSDLESARGLVKAEDVDEPGSEQLSVMAGSTQDGWSEIWQEKD